METPKGKSLLGRSVLGLEERLEEEGNKGGEDGAFTQIFLSSLSLFVFLFFNGCIFPLHQLISFSRVFDVV